MTEIVSAIILGIVQGITEWLPVSSSGHLVIFEKLFGIEPGVFFNLMLHISTLAVVMFVFRSDILDILRAVAKRDFSSESGRLALFVTAGSVPIALAGFFFESYITMLFSNLLAVGVALLLTGILLISSKFSYKPSALDYKRSLFVGTFQALALVPGVSRSGATISSSLMAGIERKKAVRFSFMLSIPAIIGATIFLITRTSIEAFQLPLFAGMLASLITGYLSLSFLIKLVLERKFYIFSFYCWALGAIIIYLTLIA